MEFNQDKAIYSQIAERIVENILENTWKPEQRIPSVREMAVSLEVNPNTVVRAYSFLQNLDIIYNRRGIGYFVSEDGKKKAAEMKKEEFVEKELPHFFKTISMLGMNMDEIGKKYEEFRRLEDMNENKQ